MKELVRSLITLVKLRRQPRGRRVAWNATIAGGVEVGDYTYVGGGTEIRGTLSRVRIGRYCSIGRHVKIFSRGQAHRYTGLSTYPFYALDPAIQRTHYNEDVGDTCIGNDVWIGSNVIILPGVRIGNGAVVGAGSVVTKAVDDFAIVAGLPAKQIGSRFSSEVAAAVASSEWWNRDYQDLRRRYEQLVLTNRAVQSQDL